MTGETLYAEWGCQAPYDHGAWQPLFSPAVPDRLLPIRCPTYMPQHFSSDLSSLPAQLQPVHRREDRSDGSARDVGAHAYAVGHAAGIRIQQVDVGRRLRARAALKGVLLVIEDLGPHAKLHLQSSLHRVDGTVAHRDKGLFLSVIRIKDRNLRIEIGAGLSGQVVDLQSAEMDGLLFVRYSFRNASMI